MAKGLWGTGTRNSGSVVSPFKDKEGGQPVSYSQLEPKLGRPLLALVCSGMDTFPEFMKNPANRIARSNQATAGVEGYVFDGADQSQMAFWTCPETTTSAEHIHEFDEYMLVVQGCYTLLIDGKRVPVRAGEEYLIPRGIPHSGEVVAGTRTIHAFGGHRADRERL